MAGTAPINSYFKPKASTMRQSTKRKAVDTLDEDEHDWTPSKRAKASKGRAVGGTPASTKTKLAHTAKQAKLAFGLQTPNSVVATPRASSSKSRQEIIGGEDTPQARSGMAEHTMGAGLPTPQETTRRSKATRVTRAHPDGIPSQNFGARAASPILVSSSSLEHVVSPPTTKPKRSARPLRPHGSVIELTSSEDDDGHDNPFLDRTIRSRSHSPVFELPQLSGPLSPLTQYSSLGLSQDTDSHFKVPELPSHLRDAPTSSHHSQIVLSSQSQEVFSGPSSSRRSSMISPDVATSPLADTADLRSSLPSSSPMLVPSSQTQERPISAPSFPLSPPPSSLPPSSAPDTQGDDSVSISHSRDVQPMNLSPLLNNPSATRQAPASSAGSTPHKRDQSSLSQVESSQMEEIELHLPPSPSKDAWMPKSTNENSPPRQRTSPLPLPGTSASPQRKNPTPAKPVSVVEEPLGRGVTFSGQTPSKTASPSLAHPYCPAIGSPTQEEITQTTPYKRRPRINSPTRNGVSSRPPVQPYQLPFGSPTQEEDTQTTPYKRHPRIDSPKKRVSPLKPRGLSVMEDSDSDAEPHSPLPAMRLGASQSDSEVDDEADHIWPGASSRPAPARVGNAPSFLYTGSGNRSRGSSQKSKQNSQHGPIQSQKEIARPAQADSQDAFFNSPSTQNSEFTQDSGSFVGSIDSIAMDVDPPSFDLHTQDLPPVKSVLDYKRDA